MIPSHPQNPKTSEAARRASATVLGIAALSMGTTAGILLPSQTKEAMATEAAIANAPTPSETVSEVESKAEAPVANVPKAIKTVPHEEISSSVRATESGQSPPVVTSSIIKHRVEQGDTLWDISKEYGVSPKTIAASNAMKSEEILSVGQTLKIPALNGINKEEARQRDRASSKADIFQAASQTPFISTQSKVPQNKVPQNKTFEESASPTRKDLNKTSKSTATLQAPQAIAPTPRKSSVVVPREAIASNTKENTISTGVKSTNSVVVPEVNATQPAETPAVSLSAVTGAVYRVRVGDTLQTIADSHGISVPELMQTNSINDPRLLQVDRELKIPRSREVRARVNQSPAVVYAETSEPTLIAQTTQARIPSPDSEDVRLQQLKDDIMRLREEYRQQRNEPLAPSVDISARPTTEEASTPTLEKLEERNSLPEPTLTVPVEDRRQSRRRDRNNSTPPAAQAPASQTAPPSQENNAALVATAPAPVQGYNRLLQMPAGQTVEPQIPPLEDRDRYLPNSPQTFNGYIWPTRGTLTSGYGPRWGRMHKGIDIAAPTGTPIYAAAPGEVVSAGWNSGGYGNLVDIRHADGSLTRYAHNSKVLVRKGDRVEQGQKISLMGSTGFSTGPHLHFEIHPSGRGAANPMAFLPRKR
ncbi:MAG: peptidoglycan DD-metalloendopeptidase family protein [Cyanobacteria bacterium SBLK]|nr:peptidoglycan DD-metalloendopeptidase family protein [Cyanobacteria bacterium SBLK]